MKKKETYTIDQRIVVPNSRVSEVNFTTQQH